MSGFSYMIELGQMLMTDEMATYLHKAAKFADLLNKNKMTAAEYADNLLQQSGLESSVDDEIASQVIHGMPVSGRHAFQMRFALL